MLDWIWKLLFKAKRLSFKNGDIFVFKVDRRIPRNQIEFMHESTRKILDKIECKNSEILFLTNDMDVFILENNNQMKDK